MHVVSGLDYLEGLDHTCGFDQPKPSGEETEASTTVEMSTRLIRGSPGTSEAVDGCTVSSSGSAPMALGPTLGERRPCGNGIAATSDPWRPGASREARVSDSMRRPARRGEGNALTTSATRLTDALGVRDRLVLGGRR
jgi:hypothetical protein